MMKDRVYLKGGLRAQALKFKWNLAMWPLFMWVSWARSASLMARSSLSVFPEPSNSSPYSIRFRSWRYCRSSIASCTIPSPKWLQTVSTVILYDIYLSEQREIWANSITILTSIVPTDYPVKHFGYSLYFYLWLSNSMFTMFWCISKSFNFEPVVWENKAVDL